MPLLKASIKHARQSEERRARRAPFKTSMKTHIRKVQDLVKAGKKAEALAALSVAYKAIDMAAKAYERDGKLSGVATGMTDLDFKMGGLQPSDLIIVAGRPGMGKTALATNIAFNIAKAYRFEVKPDGAHATTNGGIVGFFSLEMSSEQLATRIISEQSGVPSNKIRRGAIDDDEFHRISDAAREMPKDSRLFYDFMHYSNDGAARLGEIVAGHLGPWLTTRPELRGSK